MKLLALIAILATPPVTGSIAVMRLDGAAGFIIALAAVLLWF